MTGFVLLVLAVVGVVALWLVFARRVVEHRVPAKRHFRRSLPWGIVASVEQPRRVSAWWQVASLPVEALLLVAALGVAAAVRVVWP
jgi:hypothetical protein